MELINRIKPDYVKLLIIDLQHLYQLSIAKLKIKIIRHERGSNFDKYEIFKKDVHNLSYRADNVNFYWDSENLKK